MSGGRQGITITLQKAWLILVVTLLYVPMASVVLASLSDTRYMQFPHEEWTIEPYRQALASYTTTTLHLTSFRIAVVVVLLSVIIATCSALAFARYEWRGRSLFRRLLLLPIFSRSPCWALRCCSIFPHSELRPTGELLRSLT